MPFLERANEVVRAAGGRMTVQRQLIIDLLAAAGERLDAETLYQLARQRNGDINRTTVYRTLHTLEAAGLIRQQYISPDHERKYYTLTAETYHLTCRECHRVIAFTSDAIEDFKRRLESDLHVRALNVCLCVDGLCADCQAKQDEESPP